MYGMTLDEKRAEEKRIGWDKFLGRYSSNMGVHTVGFFMIMQLITSYFTFAAWPGFAIYTWILVIAPFCCYLVLLMHDADHDLILKLSEVERETGYKARY